MWTGAWLTAESWSEALPRAFLLAPPSNQPSEHYSKIHLNKHSLEYANDEKDDLTGPEVPKGKKGKKFNIEFDLISKPLPKWP